MTKAISKPIEVRRTYSMPVPKPCGHGFPRRCTGPADTASILHRRWKRPVSRWKSLPWNRETFENVFRTPTLVIKLIGQGALSMRKCRCGIAATTVTLLALWLTACGGGGSSSGGSGASADAQTSTIVVSASNLALQQKQGMTLVAQAVTELLVRNAAAVMTDVTVSGGELGNGRVFTTNDAGVVNIPLFGGSNYTICVEDDCTTVFVPKDSVVIFNANTKAIETFRAEDEEVVGDFAVPGQENKRILCHKGKVSIQVAKQAVYDAHIAHGDRAGGCQISTSSGDDQEPMQPGNGDQIRVMICHKTGNGNLTLTLSESAAQSHLDHGDTLGPCGQT